VSRKHRTITTLFAILLLACSALAYGNKPLTDAEQREWQQFATAEKARTDALSHAANDLLNTPTGADSITVHSHYQAAWFALRLVQTERAAWLGNLRAAKGCPDCVIEGKELVPPKAAQ
jgi:hypothetical protein